MRGCETKRRAWENWLNVSFPTTKPSSFSHESLIRHVRGQLVRAQKFPHQDPCHSSKAREAVLTRIVLLISFPFFQKDSQLTLETARKHQGDLFTFGSNDGSSCRKTAVNVASDLSTLSPCPFQKRSYLGLITAVRRAFKKLVFQTDDLLRGKGAAAPTPHPSSDNTFVIQKH